MIEQELEQCVEHMRVQLNSWLFLEIAAIWRETQPFGGNCESSLALDVEGGVLPHQKGCVDQSCVGKLDDRAVPRHPVPDLERQGYGLFEFFFLVRDWVGFEAAEDGGVGLQVGRQRSRSRHLVEYLEHLVNMARATEDVKVGISCSRARYVGRVWVANGSLGSMLEPLIIDCRRSSK
jgi:hypothetical protein